jgi:hypothetical protein
MPHLQIRLLNFSAYKLTFEYVSQPRSPLRTLEKVWPTWGENHEALTGRMGCFAILAPVEPSLRTEIIGQHSDLSNLIGHEESWAVAPP